MARIGLLLQEQAVDQLAQTVRRLAVARGRLLEPDSMTGAHLKACRTERDGLISALQPPRFTVWTGESFDKPGDESSANGMPAVAAACDLDAPPLLEVSSSERFPTDPDEVRVHGTYREAGGIRADELAELVEAAVRSVVGTCT